MKRILAAAGVAACGAWGAWGGEAGETLQRWGFEEDGCGGMPKGWWVFPKVPGTNELCRWVGNAESLEGERSFTLDFSQLPIRFLPGAGHGYTNCGLKPVKEGWCELTMCLKREDGAFNVEVRGPHKGGMHYQVLGLTVGGTVRLITAGTGYPGKACGEAAANRWTRVKLRFPSCGAGSGVVRARVDAYAGRGKWEEGEWVEAELGKVEMTGPVTHFALTGGGRMKVHLDEVEWRGCGR